MPNCVQRYNNYLELTIESVRFLQLIIYMASSVEPFFTSSTLSIGIMPSPRSSSMTLSLCISSPSVYTLPKRFAALRAMSTARCTPKQNPECSAFIIFNYSLQFHTKAVYRIGYLVRNDVNESGFLCVRHDIRNVYGLPHYHPYTTFFEAVRMYINR